MTNPTRIGRFQISRELGRGSLGSVYLGHDPVLGRDLAIKTFRADVGDINRLRYEDHFIQEARAMGSLAHPHIVTIYEASIDKGNSYVAMELLDGQELNRLLEQGRRFTPDEAASICWKIADALSHAHGRGVIHRDIKPANIFMIKDDQPKLVDFGIARAPKPADAQQSGNEENAAAGGAKNRWAHTLSRPDRLLGTPNYMSPEQAQNKAVDARSDIYSLGVVMYEMLVGVLPFHAPNDKLLLQQVIGKTPVPPHRLDPAIPAALSRIVMTAMNKRPDRRYPDAGAMALDLKRYLIRMRRARRRMKIPVSALDTEGASGSPGLASRLGRKTALSIGLGMALLAVAMAATAILK
ncbi:serine/threonine-protein kinase [Noviherbaspirillum galbum]|uniref:non-specific serine/threonine protein kinase n=1 Tax=Noviherbaspirillum galbum TaxID=2709383 RepID=A0A6B3SLE3_9BURK|nr:serine/threonine-protein kinase [Noviherbaspirillum galbum]NEX61557.1 serine/threonine protein kinase [Noviherbaspirillum galbum]